MALDCRTFEIWHKWHIFIIFLKRKSVKCFDDVDKSPVAINPSSKGDSTTEDNVNFIVSYL